MPLFCLILDFLHDLYTKPYRYSSLNTVRSAISALYSIDKTDVGQNIGKHPLICRFLNSVFNEIPPTPKFQEVWPVKQVLAYLEQFTPLHGFKVEGTYVETSHAYCSSNWIEMPSFSFDISREHMKKIPNKLHLFFIGTPQDKPGHVFGNVRLFQYPDKSVYSTLEHYIEVTQP